MPDKNRPTQHRYPTELRDRGVRMVLDEFERSSERHGVVTRIAAQLGVWTESLRKWVKQAEVDGGHVPGVSTADQQRITALEKENRELRRPNEIVLQPRASRSGVGLAGSYRWIRPLGCLAA